MKSLKKVLSVVLAVAMLACSMAVVASADGNYTTVKSWGLTEFANFAESGLVSDADHAVLSRQKSVGAAVTAYTATSPPVPTLPLPADTPTPMFCLLTGAEYPSVPKPPTAFASTAG